MATRAQPRAADARRFAAIVAHLARREMDSAHRTTTLGWLWPLARQLAQLAVLVFVFSSVIDLGIEHFALFVLTGLVAWNWFSTGVGNGTSSVLSRPQFLSQRSFPPLVLPAVAVAVPFIDAAIASPVLVALAVAEGVLSWGIVLVPLIAVVQLVLMAGLAWLFAAGAVVLRDIPNVVGLALTLLFYLTPVFYSRDAIPDEYHWILHANPLTTLLEAYRAAIFDQPWPGAGRMVAVAGAAGVLAVAGAWTFRRLQHRFADYL